MSHEAVIQFLTQGDHQELMKVLSGAKCNSCKGTGERNDAELGDIYYNTWVCPDCSGMGWCAQSVREIVLAVDESVFHQIEDRQI